MGDAQTPRSEPERNGLDHSASEKSLLARRPLDWNVQKGELHPYEVFWRTHQPWLAELGYTVRRRYRADWKASWLAMDPDKYFRSEDAQMLSNINLLDARRSDGQHVIIKRSKPSVHPHEADIRQYLSSPDLAKDPRNHSIPIYDVLISPHEPDRSFIVMPLVRPLDDPSFDTISEVIDFISQIFEGMSFLHEHRIAHRDGNANNIMMDPTAMYPDMYHPAEIDRTYDYKGKAFHYTRTQRPPKYYIIDFGISCRYLPEQLPVVEYVILGGDKSPPEHQNDAEQADPFPTDVYFLGNMIRTNFIEPKSGFRFIEPLVNDMTQTDPAKRPTMNDVVTRFAKIRASLSAWKLRSRVAPRNEFFMATPFRAISHWKRRLGYMLSGTPAIPTAK